MLGSGWQVFEHLEDIVLLPCGLWLWMRGPLLFKKPWLSLGLYGQCPRGEERDTLLLLGWRWRSGLRMGSPQHHGLPLWHPTARVQGREAQGLSVVEIWTSPGAVPAMGGSSVFLWHLAGVEWLLSLCFLISKAALLVLWLHTADFCWDFLTVPVDFVGLLTYGAPSLRSMRKKR